MWQAVDQTAVGSREMLPGQKLLSKGLRRHTNDFAILIEILAKKCWNECWFSCWCLRPNKSFGFEPSTTIQRHYFHIPKLLNCFIFNHTDNL